MTDLPSPPLWLQGGTYAADDDRALIRSLVAGQGVVQASDLTVTANGTPNMSVNVAPGRAFVQRTGATDFYLVEVDTTTNLTVSAADPTNPRKDIVVVRVYDAAYSGSANKATLEVIAGTPAASPSEPTVPNNAIKLAVITVAAGASSITSSAIAKPTNGVPVVTWAANAAAGAPVPTGFRNVIRNGDMGVAQRGGGPWTTSGSYTVDGWRMDFVGGTFTVSRQTTPVGSGFGAGGASATLRGVVDGQAAAGDYAVLRHRVEGVRTLAGQQVTLSFIAAATSGTPKIGISVRQNFGTGGTPSAEVATAVQAVTISTTATLYTVSFAMPSISGKTLGTNSNDYLELIFWLSAGSASATEASSIGIQSTTIDITDVQLEAGAVATPFERLPVAEQLAWCQRYYQRRSGGFFAQGLGELPDQAAFSLPLSVPLRATPTVTADIGAANLQAHNGAGIAGGTFASGITATTHNESWLFLRLAGNSGLSAGAAYWLFYNGNTQLNISAEL